MTALGLTIAECLFALLLGLGCTASLRRSPLNVPDVLLAPATGLALLMAVVVPLNRAGLGVDRFALPAILILGAASLIVTWRYRKFIAPALRQSVPFGVIGAVAMLIVASPMISFGSNWFSFANDDGVNYALSAERMRMGGLHAVPSGSDFSPNRDVRLDYYFLNGAPSERYGGDELLALSASVTNENALRTLMPLMLMLDIVCIWATAALVYRGPRGFYNALACCLGLCFCALLSFAAADQLLGQAVGVVFTSAAIARGCDPDVTAAIKRDRFALCSLAVLALSGLFFGYPELAPFALMTIVAYHLFRRPDAVRARLTFLGFVALGTGFVLNAYIRNVLFVTAQRLDPHQTQDLNLVFPYFLLPTGIANLFGVMPIASFPPEPWTSLGIFMGLCFLAVTVSAVIWGIRRRLPAAYLAALFLFTGLTFYFHRSGFASQRSGFALFKLAMYAEPALIALLATACVAGLFARRTIYRAVVAAAALAFLGVNAFSQHIYVSASRSAGATAGANFTEVPDISGGRLFERLARIRQSLRFTDVIVSDTFNAVVAKIESFYGRGSAGVAFPSSPEQSVMTYTARAKAGPFFDHSRDAILSALYSARMRRFSNQAFPSDGTEGDDHFVSDHLNDVRPRSIWITGSENSPFNRVRIAGIHGVKDALDAPNVLAFISSSLGKGYFSHEDPTGLYALEPDFYGRSSMSGIGRYMLFEVLNPKPPLHLRLSFTETLRADGENRLPRVVAIGTRRVYFPTTGRGSAAVVSGAIAPRFIAGHAYVLIDLGLAPKRFPDLRRGLMRLWGTDIPIDPRFISGFLRDLSIVSQSRRPASRLATFPSDLLAPDAEYSGIYEDGWASEDVATTLDVKESGQVQLLGQVPLIDDPAFSTDLSVFVDGFLVASRTLGVGESRVTVMAGRGVHKIAWRFSAVQRLPGGDSRPVTIRILSIGS